MSQTCAQCNAPLPLGPSGTIAKCAYCGTDTRIAGEATPGIIVITDPIRRAQLRQEIAGRATEAKAIVAAERRLARNIMLIFFVLLFSFIGIASWRGWNLSWQWRP